MFVFPLGLQAKTRDFPWLTVAIFVATCAYSVVNFNATHGYIATWTNSPAAIHRVQAQKRLITAGCSGLGFSIGECDLFRRELRPDAKESQIEFVGRFKRVASRSKVEKKRLGELTKFLSSPASLLKIAGASRELPEFEAFEAALQEEVRVSGKSAREHSLLTRASYSVQNVLRATFLHGDWMHLLGNMVFFLMFAIPLEQRVGAFAFFLIYFIGGGAGLTLDLFLSTESTRPLLGASASVSAVAAAFMVAFWSFSVRLFVSLFFVFNQIVLVPTWMFFAFFVVMHDLIGAISLQGSNVAHVAHLGGFALGALLGGIAIQARQLPKPFAFPFELKMFVKSRQTDNVDARVAILRKILFHNPYNSVALKEAWNVIDKKTSLYWTEIPREARRFLTNHFFEVLTHLQSGTKGELKEFLERTEKAAWPWAELVPESGLFRMMGFVRDLQMQSRGEEVHGLARILATAYPNSDEAQALLLIEKRTGEKRTVEKRTLENRTERQFPKDPEGVIANVGNRRAGS